MLILRQRACGLACGFATANRPGGVRLRPTHALVMNFSPTAGWK
jgi:hypothetical protein